MLKMIAILLVGLFNLERASTKNDLETFQHKYIFIFILAACVSTYDQCGGVEWKGETSCCSDSVCTYGNDYYWQCLPKSQSSTTPATTTNTKSTTSPRDGRQDGVTTRYWDCCKASCGWTGKASVTNPVKTCAADAVTPVGVDTQSGCNGGTAYMCSNQQPWNVSSSLSYGFAAAHIAVSDSLS